MTKDTITITKKTIMYISLGVLVPVLLFVYSVGSWQARVDAQVVSNQTDIKTIEQNLKALNDNLGELNNNVVRLNTLLEER